ncbi:palmitoyltransferase ZDHHC8B [Chanos chanos]|uniref:Palmitoyltransferase n=1 Tax=Chanos chanos TaxID=29144 RepID=A0A6J2WTM1_CHACN|nr:probable palmitoyltransferase ZDHHC8 [Chanos chanos]
MPNSVGKSFKPTQYIPVSTAATLLVGSTTLFFVFTCPWLTKAISPAVPIYNGIIFLFVLANFSMATFMDPGIFPRANEDEDKDDDFRAPLYKNVEIKGIQVRMKWCATCHFYRPPRCSHCSVCDNCVEDFDHHCPWVNNCIGRRNYRYFFLFLLSLSTHIIGVFSFGLLFVLHHLETLGALHTTVTLVVMCVAGLFFIPVMGLTGFHMVLVARGRTTNEQVTGKFRGGVNPFTKGCCGNVKHVLCSPLAPRYMVDPRKKAPVSIQPPFLRPALSDRHIAVKVSDNGIHSSILRSKSRTSLDGLNERGLDPQPPVLPPKADRHNQLKNQLTSSEESSLSSKTVNPSTPAMYKYRPSFGTMPKVHYHTAGEKISMPDDCKPTAILEEGCRAHDYRSEPNLDLPDYRNAPLHRTYQSSPFQLDSFSTTSRSLSLRQGQRQGERAGFGPTKVEALTSTPHRGVFSPGTLSNRNGSLSYDSLLHPSVSPATVVAGTECTAHPGVPSMGFHSPYLPTKMCHVQRQQAPPPSYSPVRVGAIYRSHSPHPRDPSPVRYDNLSKTIMASIQERKEMEEREKLSHIHGHTHSHTPSHTHGDSGVFDTCGGYGLPPGTCYPEGPLRGAGSRGATPPAYGSRDNLMGAGGGVGGYGARTPVLRSAGSSLARVPRTSSSSLHTDGSSSSSVQGRPADQQYRSPAHQSQHSPCPVPRSPSYTHQKVTFISAMERTDSPQLGGPRENIAQGKVNGQPKAQTRDCHLATASSTPDTPLSPSRHTNVKKVTGVGGTTYEISV